VKSIHRFVLALACAAAVPFAGAAVAEDAQKPEKGPAAVSSAKPGEGEVRYQRMAYPLKSCPISGDELGADAVDHVVDGRLVRLCCKDCVGKVEAKKQAIFEKIDAAVIEAQRAGYPLERCPISGEKLADHGGGVDCVIGTRLVRLCCKDCVAGLKAAPGPALDKLDRAYIAAQKESYPLDTCPVSGEKLGSMGDAVDYLYGTRLVRLCCGSCKKTVDKDPAKVFAKIDAARAEKAKEKPGLERKG
jgi:hypothetical protein